jgi:hypothetical protein
MKKLSSTKSHVRNPTPAPIARYHGLFDQAPRSGGSSSTFIDPPASLIFQTLEVLPLRCE